ncbi:MAG: glycosyltransferase [Anaerolineales bacterium]
MLHPAGELPKLPTGIQLKAIRTNRSTWERVRYDQVALPRVAAEVGAALLLIFGEQVPLRARMPIVAVPPIGLQPAAAGGVEMLRRAAGRAGLRGAGIVLFAADLDDRAHTERTYPPFVSSPFQTAEVGSGGSERQRVLCYDTDPKDIRKALAAWTWVDGSLGDTYPLQFLSWDPQIEELIHATATEFDVAESVAARPATNDLAQLFREAAAFLSVRPLAWGQPYRWALASGVPVAAFGSPAASAILGDAGYLVTDGDTRALGAACLSLLVQEELAESLRVKGRRRAAGYRDRPPVELITEAAKQSGSARGGLASS